MPQLLMRSERVSSASRDLPSDRMPGSARKLILATLICLALPLAAAGAEKSGVGSCRNGVLSLIQYLDANEQDTANYAHAAKAVTETCGPAGRIRPQRSSAVSSDPSVCRRLALRVLDIFKGCGPGENIQQLSDLTFGLCTREASAVLASSSEWVYA
jgi:hypothetical protein